MQNSISNTRKIWEKFLFFTFFFLSKVRGKQTAAADSAATDWTPSLSKTKYLSKSLYFIFKSSKELVTKFLICRFCL